ncbi:MAG: type I-U CRISPR-associated protein Csb2 [Acidobacteriota bacterium]
MIAISLRFLTGRFHATPWGHHVNEGVVEWPPSSWRLLRALIATFHRARPSGVSEEQLIRIVDALSAPPLFRLPPATTAHTRHYDVANGSVKFFDTFVVLDPGDPTTCVWPEAGLDDGDRTALAVLLSSLGTFGRAESWCEAELLEEDELREPNSYPLEDGQSLSGLEPVRLLMPDSTGRSLIDALLIETSAMRKKKQLDPPGTRWVTYVRDSKALTARGAAPPRRTASKALTNIAHYALDSSVLPLPQDALPFAEQVRRALIRNRVDTSHSETITGKHADGTPLEGHEHAHYFPTDEDLDGRIDHVTIYAPRGFDDADLEAIGSLRTIFRSGNRPEVRMVLAGLGGPVSRSKDDASSSAFTRRFGEGDPAEAGTTKLSEVSIFAKARRWRSVTPFSLPRFPNRGGGKPPRPRDLPEGQLVRELKNRGLPEPVSIKRIEGYQVEGRPLVRWLEFHATRFNGKAGNALAGFEIEFAEPVRGPLAVGFACHFGLGLFLPVS